MSPTPQTPRALFLAALKLPPEDRPEFLRQNCGPDDALRRRVEVLLAAHDRNATEAPPSAPDDTAPFADSGGAGTAGLPGPAVGAVIGPYRLREQLGEGGMGLVFVAEQAEPVRRKVALKVIKPGMDSRQVVAR